MQDNNLTAFVALAIVLAAAVFSAVLIVALDPWFARYVAACCYRSRRASDRRCGPIREGGQQRAVGLH